MNLSVIAPITASLMGYSITIPDWVVYLLVISVLVSLPFSIARILKVFISVGCDSDSDEETSNC